MGRTNSVLEARVVHEQKKGEKEKRRRPARAGVCGPEVAREIR